MKIRLTDISAVIRLPDPTYPTNLAIGLLSATIVVVGGIAQLLTGRSPIQSLLWGIGAGLAVFLAWALARELDPDHDLSAFVGAGLMLIGLLVSELPSLLALFWLLVVLRIVNRTVGLPARLLDSLGALCLGGWLTWQGNWMAGLTTAVAFLLDGLLSPRARHHLFLSGIAFAGTVVFSVFQGNVAMEHGPAMPTVLAAVVMGGLFVVVVGTTGELKAVGDATGEPLSARRVQAAQVLALVTALLYAWWEGASGMGALLPLWAAMAGAALYRLALLFLSRRR